MRAHRLCAAEQLLYTGRRGADSTFHVYSRHSRPPQAVPLYGWSSLFRSILGHLIQEALLSQLLLCWHRVALGSSFTSVFMASGEAPPIHSPCPGQDTSPLLSAEGIVSSSEKESQGKKKVKDTDRQCPRRGEGEWDDSRAGSPKNCGRRLGSEVHTRPWVLVHTCVFPGPPAA